MKFLSDPLITFLAVGAMLLVAGQYWEPDSASFRIDITPAEIARLADQWQVQMQRPPTAEEMTGLVDAFVREEIYYREASKLGLDTDDTIVRRRLVQKLTFLTEDIATTTPPDDATLEAWYRDHQDVYTQPERISFTHRYFSVDRRPDAKADAEQALTDEALTDDPFMLQKSYAQRSIREIGDLFGRAFATEITALAGQGWQGPIRSAYGWHLVRIEERMPATLIPFAQVRDRVLADFQMEARKIANSAYYDSLKSQYTIVYSD